MFDIILTIWGGGGTVSETHLNKSVICPNCWSRVNIYVLHHQGIRSTSWVPSCPVWMPRCSVTLLKPCGRCLAHGPSSSLKVSKTSQLQFCSPNRTIHIIVNIWRTKDRVIHVFILDFVLFKGIVPPKIKSNTFVPKLYDFISAMKLKRLYSMQY